MFDRKRLEDLLLLFRKSYGTGDASHIVHNGIKVYISSSELTSPSPEVFFSLKHNDVEFIHPSYQGLQVTLTKDSSFNDVDFGQVLSEIEDAFSIIPEDTIVIDGIGYKKADILKALNPTDKGEDDVSDN